MVLSAANIKYCQVLSKPWAQSGPSLTWGYALNLVTQHKGIAHFFSSLPLPVLFPLPSTPPPLPPASLAQVALDWFEILFAFPLCFVQLASSRTNLALSCFHYNNKSALANTFAVHSLSGLKTPVHNNLSGMGAALGMLLTGIHGLTSAIQENYWKQWMSWNNLHCTVLCHQWCSHASPLNTHAHMHVHTHTLTIETLSSHFVSVAISEPGRALQISCAQHRVIFDFRMQQVRKTTGCGTEWVVCGAGKQFPSWNRLNAHFSPSKSLISTKNQVTVTFGQVQ